jgi:hypothetical protein
MLRASDREEDCVRRLRAILAGGLVVGALSLGWPHPVAAAPSEQVQISWPDLVRYCIVMGAPDIGACIRAAGPSTYPHP